MVYSSNIGSPFGYGPSPYFGASGGFGGIGVASAGTRAGLANRFGSADYFSGFGGGFGFPNFGGGFGGGFNGFLGGLGGFGFSGYGTGFGGGLGGFGFPNLGGGFGGGFGFPGFAGGLGGLAGFGLGFPIGGLGGGLGGLSTGLMVAQLIGSIFARKSNAYAYNHYNHDRKSDNDYGCSSCGTTHRLEFNT